MGRTTHHLVELPLRRPTRVGTRDLAVRACQLTRIEVDGLVGWGEATPVPGWAPPTPGTAEAFARADVDAQRAGVSLATHLGGGRAAGEVPVNAMIGDGEPDETAEAAAAAVDAGFPAVKVKVASGAVQRDVDRIRAVGEVVAGRCALRLDANARWDRTAAEEVLVATADVELDYVEEPVADLSDLPELRSAVPCKVALDEHATTPATAARAIDERLADVLILKPTQLGSPFDVLRLARRAADVGIGVVVTTVIDSAIGTTAALHVAAALPTPILPCGLATSASLLIDVADPPPVVNGAMTPSGEPGLGLAVRLPEG